MHQVSPIFHIFALSNPFPTMTTPAIIISVIYVLCLTSSVVPRSVGMVRADDKPSQKLLVPFIFGATQAIMACLGNLLGNLIAHLFSYVANYLAFIMMLVVTIKMFVDSMRVLKGKMMYTAQKELDFALLAVMASSNTFLMSLFGPTFQPFGNWFYVIIALAAFLWALVVSKLPFEPKMLRKVSFVAFSASAFMLVVAILYMFTDLLV